MRGVNYLFFLAFLICSCGESKKETSQDEVKSDVTFDVTATYPKHITVNDTIRTSGRLKKENSIDLSFETSGVINTILVRRGQKIKKGDLLMTLEDKNASERIKKLNLAQLRNEEELKVIRQQLKKTEADLANQIDLFQDSLVSEESVKNLRIEVDRLTSIESTILLSNESNAQDQSIARTDAQKYAIRAAMSGEIMDVPVDIGEFVSPGQIVLKIDQGEVDIIVAEVSEHQVVRINRTNQAEVILDALPEEVYTARVSQMPYEHKGAKYEVEVLLDRVNKPLLSGMYGQVKIFTNHSEKGYAIPLTALNSAHGKDGTILIAEDGRAKKVEISISTILHDLVLIENKLDSTAQVLINVNGIVKEGDQVNVLRTL